MPDIFFSVLIPSIPSRMGRLSLLFQELERQCEAYPTEVEVLSFMDNKQRPVGLKRDALVQSAQGSHLAFVDDDDYVSGDYLSSIVPVIRKNPDVDVIVFDHEVTINREGPFVVHSGIEYENEQCRKVNSRWADITRKPLHPSVWRTALARSAHFPPVSWGEDWAWAQQLIPQVKRQIRIPRVLHYYYYDDKVTEASVEGALVS